MTSNALSFLNSDRLDDINDEHLFQELAGALDPDEHFDSCSFLGASQEYNENFQDALDQAAPDEQDWGDAADQFGQALHAAQDFYAHSNWVDLGQTRIVQSGRFLWDLMTPYSVRDGVMFVEGEDEEPFGPGSLSRDGNKVTVHADSGDFEGVISGTFGVDDQCPDNIALSHDDLNKDDPGRPGFAFAELLAIVQTEHEFYRLVSKIHDSYGSAALADFLAAFVKGDQASQDALQALLVDHDVIAPSITCPPPVTVEATSSSGSANVDLGVPQVSDQIVANRFQTPVVSKDFFQAGFPLGTTTVTWTATDFANFLVGGPNKATCQQSVTVTDTAAPQSELTIGQPIFTSDPAKPFVTSETPFTVSAGDSGSGVANISYRSYPHLDAPPGYTTVDSSPATFKLSGPAGLYAIEYRATDNQGNVENTQLRYAYLDNAGPVVTIDQPIATSYDHSSVLVLDYSVTDGQGAGVGSVKPELDGSKTLAGHGLDDGQAIELLTELGLGTHTFTVDATDNLGQAGSSTVTFEVVASAAGLSDSIGQFLAGGDIKNRGLARSLESKVAQAKVAHDKGDCQTAIELYEALINQISAQSGKGIDPEAAAIMIADAEYLITNCP